jgi:hypothetical protein
MMEEDFTCAICQRNVCMRWNGRGRDRQVAPVCTRCEGWYSEGIGKPTAGSFMDRRIVARGIALSQALHDAAARQQWEPRHAAA